MSRSGIESRAAALAAGGGWRMWARPMGERGSKAATATGLSGRSVNVDRAGFAKSAWSSNTRSASVESPNSSAVKYEK